MLNDASYASIVDLFGKHLEKDTANGPLKGR